MPCECIACVRDNILNGVLTAKCNICVSIVNVDRPFDIIDETVVCKKCISEHYSPCVCCSKVFKNGLLKDLSHRAKSGDMVIEKVCERCVTQFYRKCEECSEVFNRNLLNGHSDKVLCRQCFNKYYQVCSFCANTFKIKDITHERQGKKICDPCWSWYGPIDRYETKPNLIFNGRPPHFYGVELEVELENQNRAERGAKAQEVVDLFPKDFVIVKEDGSLNCGFEIVTQPATLEEQIKKWSPFFDKRPKNIISYNAEKCGLHIHCARRPLSLLTIAKMVVFVNAKENQQLVEIIAGRTSNRYAVYTEKKHAEVKKPRNMTREDRYQAINLLNKDTVEFRIFKGTLKKESLFKSIEFCDSLIQFCMAGNNSISYCLNKNNYISYVRTRAKDYPHLYAFISSKVLKEENTYTKKYGFPLTAVEDTQQK